MIKRSYEASKHMKKPRMDLDFIRFLLLNEIKQGAMERKRKK